MIKMKSTKISANSVDHVQPSKLPEGVVAVQEWQSASNRLDSEMALTLKKMGVHLTWFEIGDAEYCGMAISKEKLSASAVKNLQDNFDEYLNANQM